MIAIGYAKSNVLVHAFDCEISWSAARRELDIARIPVTVIKTIATRRSRNSAKCGKIATIARPCTSIGAIEKSHRGRAHAMAEENLEINKSAIWDGIGKCLGSFTSLQETCSAQNEKREHNAGFFSLQN
jgi:hypothetical protein